MNINESLLESLWIEHKQGDYRGNEDLLQKYGCWHHEFEDFLLLKRPFDQKQQQAICIIDNIMTSHGKQDLLKCVSELARVEHGIKELEPWVRDHVVHALISFLLGIYINDSTVVI